jgi:hypothetical protein
MKRLMSIIVLLVPLLFLITNAAFADPRMETNNNFCHFILDTLNTDNEVFVAGCDPVITVVEIIPEEGATETQCEENYTASGYALVKKVMPAEGAPVSPGNRLVFTSDDSDAPCTMVESNGTAYQTQTWISVITVGEANTRGLVKVQFELFCQDEL